jgi:tetratricopeptide (TPR) repeat protein
LHRLLTRLERELAQPPPSAEERAELETAKDLARQAEELFQQEDYDAAAERLEEALSIQLRVLGENHLDHADLLRQLARTREMLAQHDAVLPLVRRIADVHVHVLGEEHPATAIALSDLMVCYAGEGDDEATRALQEQILQSMERTLGPEDPRVRSARRTYEVLGSEAKEKERG